MKAYKKALKHASETAMWVCHSSRSTESCSAEAQRKNTLLTPALKNLTLSFLNHRVPTERNTGAIKIAHTSATSNLACCLFISLWQMV